MGLRGVCTSPNGVTGCKSLTCPGGAINMNIDSIRATNMTSDEASKMWNNVASDLTQIFPHEKESILKNLSAEELTELEHTPVNIDSKLAEIYDQMNSISSDINVRAGWIADYKKRIDPSYQYYRAYDVERYTQQIHKTESEIEALKLKLDATAKLKEPYEAKFNEAGGWSRAFLVANGNGHVHKSMNCTTCYPTTQFSWLPQYSGQDESLIVADAGSSSCAVCYPTVINSPVYKQKSKVQTPEQKLASEEKAALKAEKDAKKQAAGILSPDGTPLRVQASWSSYTEVIKTERTAQTWATDALIELADWKAKRGDTAWDSSELEERIAKIELNSEKVIAALAAKRNVSVEDVRNELTEKAQKKIKARGY